MSLEQSISPLGLKLIKAFEGYRETATTLVTGQRVIGYGHPLGDEERHDAVSRDAALTLLRADIAPVEAMVRETVFTPLSQGQFDALCSLVFNIGPVNFMTSNIRHALNNGRLLDAASAFDEWRKAEIDGKTYVVDALVRRRTAEKALFLRPDKTPARAPNASMDVQSDDSYTRISDDEAYAPDAGIINPGQHKRREEDHGGVLTLTERAQTAGEQKSIYDPINYADEEHMDAAISEGHLEIPRYSDSDAENQSPIALAAAEVSERLDALIDTARMESEDKVPAQKVKSAETLPVAANSNEGKSRRPEQYDPDSSEKFKPANTSIKKPANETGEGVYGIFMFLGGCLIALGLSLYYFAQNRLGAWAEFVTPWAVIIGGLLLLGGLYYGLRGGIRRRNS